MRTVKLGERGPEVSRLGFGCMRLPMTDAGKVDRDLAIPMLHRALDLGVTYFDTAIGYCRGDSQAVLGEAMEGHRDRVVLSTKNHLHSATDDAWWAKLEESLRLLRTDHVDIYNHHGLGWESYQKHIAGERGKLRLMQRAREQGLIRHICCSFHDKPEALVKLVETGAFDVITVQYNLLNRELEEGIARADELGIGVVVMGPVGGGRLGVDSTRIREATGNAVTSTPEAALRFVLAHPGVDVALSGMSTMEQLEENARIVAGTEPFTSAEIAAMEDEMQRAKERTGVPCPACGYCMPCPHGVDIPENFRVYNEYRMYGLIEPVRRGYGALVRDASACVRCGACVPKCPQGIDIPTELSRAVALFDTRFEGVAALLSLRGARDGRLTAELVLRNLLDRAVEPVATLRLDGGASVEPATVAAGVLEPLDTVVKRGLQVQVTDGASRVKGTCEIAIEGDTRTGAIDEPFFWAPADALRRHEYVAREHDFRRHPDLAAAHGYAVELQRDGDALAVRVDVRTAGHAPGEPGSGKGARLECYLDLRPAPERANAWEAGVEQITFALDRGACALKSGREMDLDLQWEKTADGCRMAFRLPLSALAPGDGRIPASAGMDWMLAVAAPDGRDAAQLVYSHRRQPWKNPAVFAPLFL